MTASQITLDVAGRLGIDLCSDEDVAVFDGKVKAVMGVLSGAGCQQSEDDRYIEAVTIGVNDLLSMESSGGGFSAGFYVFMNQIRFGAGGTDV